MTPSAKFMAMLWETVRGFRFMGEVSRAWEAGGTLRFRDCR